MPSPNAPHVAYDIPESSQEVVYEIKKSRFIAVGAHITTKQGAKDFLNTSKQRYPDARHHCWAYQFGPPNMPHSAAMSDDGEPSGTAGKPILNVLKHKDIGDIMIVVTRYFGGIKLGASGLVRAYSHAAQLAIDNLTLKQQVPMLSIAITCDFSQEQTVRHWLSSIHNKNLQAQYLQQVVITTDLAFDQWQSLHKKCQSLGIEVEHDS